MARIETIGDLKDAAVMVNHDDRTVILTHPDMPPIKFSIEHPYIQGTKLEAHARAVLDGVNTELPTDV